MGTRFGGFFPGAFQVCFQTTSSLALGRWWGIGRKRYRIFWCIKFRLWDRKHKHGEHTAAQEGAC